MTACEWIVCERTGRWAAALRTQLARQTRSPAVAAEVHEVRSLSELAARLDERPLGLALIEVRSANLDEVLAWLAEAGAARPTANYVALLDSDLNQDDPTGFLSNRGFPEDIAAALLEAGAAELARSPRHLEHLLGLGDRCSVLRPHRANKLLPGESFSDWAWAALPWQET